MIAEYSYCTKCPNKYGNQETTWKFISDSRKHDKEFLYIVDHIFEFPRLGLVGGSVLKMAHGSKGNKSSLNSYVYWDILNYIRQL